MKIWSWRIRLWTSELNWNKAVRNLTAQPGPNRESLERSFPMQRGEKERLCWWADRRLTSVGWPWSDCRVLVMRLVAMGIVPARCFRRTLPPIPLCSYCYMFSGGEEVRCWLVEALEREGARRWTAEAWNCGPVMAAAAAPSHSHNLAKISRRIGSREELAAYCFFSFSREESNDPFSYNSNDLWLIKDWSWFIHFHIKVTKYYPIFLCLIKDWSWIIPFHIKVTENWSYWHIKLV